MTPLPLDTAAHRPSIRPERQKPRDVDGRLKFGEMIARVDFAEDATVVFTRVLEKSASY